MTDLTADEIEKLKQRIDENTRINRATGCWDWQGCTLHSRGGYGSIKVGLRARLVHRVALRVWCGPYAEQLCVLHTCDRPQCCNPDHLWLGTRADNNADKVAKGRHRSGDQRGERNPGAKLTEAEAREIRGKTGTQSAIASQYGISQALMSHIKRGDCWSHV